MKAEELRIGNYVFDFDGKAKQIHETATYPKDYGFEDVVKIEGVCLLISEIEPIPLTEEWLLSFGFVFYDDFDSWILNYKHLMKEFIIRSDFIVSDMEFVPNIKYVHKLQNLYFALTGEELTIKE